MRVFGINYDTGLTVERRSTRPSFVEDEVRRDMRAIANDLHATAIRVSGEDVERLEFAGRCALDAGLEVWLSPTSCDLDPDAYLEHVERAAAAAERLRSGGEVVAVLGTRDVAVRQRVRSRRRPERPHRRDDRIPRPGRAPTRWPR